MFGWTTRIEISATLTRPRLGYSAICVARGRGRLPLPSRLTSEPLHWPEVRREKWHSKAQQGRPEYDFFFAELGHRSSQGQVKGQNDNLFLVDYGAQLTSGSLALFTQNVSTGFKDKQCLRFTKLKVKVRSGQVTKCHYNTTYWIAHV